MKTNFKYYIFFAASLITFLSACKKDDDLVEVPPPVNESEVVTTLRLIMTDSITGNPAGTFTFRDPDGDGGAVPDITDTIVLQPNTTYLCSVVLLNETVNPADSISNEVAEEANDHMFFYHFTGVNLTHVYADLDTNAPPLPIGLQNRFRTGAASTGTTQVILKHQPGVKDGSETPGDTDIDVSFYTRIQ